MVNIGIGTALLSAVLGYAVVFLGILFLMAVIILTGKLMNRADTKAEETTDASISSVSVKSAFGIDPKKIAAITAAIAEYEGEAR